MPGGVQLCPAVGWCSGCSTPTMLTASLSLSLSPCPSPVPRLRDWNAEGSFISCLQDLTEGSWQEGVTRRLGPAHTVAAGAQGQEQEQVLAPDVELMRVSSTEDSDWQPQHPASGWPEEPDSRCFGQVRLGAAADAALCLPPRQEVLAELLPWPLGGLLAQNRMLHTQYVSSCSPFITQAGSLLASLLSICSGRWPDILLGQK